jgi:hypothetical protein
MGGVSAATSSHYLLFLAQSFSTSFTYRYNSSVRRKEEAGVHDSEPQPKKEFGIKGASIKFVMNFGVKIHGSFAWSPRS